MKTLAHEFLDVEKEDCPVTQETYDSLDALLKKAEKKIINKGATLETAENIASFLFNHQFRIQKSSDTLDTIYESLHTKRYNCLIGSILYAAIGERLGVPISVVLAHSNRWFAPGHCFVRIGDSQEKNWDPLSRESLSNEEYAHHYNISQATIEHKFSLCSLTKQEVLSCAYTQRALRYGSQRELPQKIESLKRALELFPKNTLAVVELAIEFISIKDYEKAQELISQSLYSQQANITALNLALLRKTRKKEPAPEEYEAVLKQDPTHLPARIELMDILFEAKEFGKVKEHIELAWEFIQETYHFVDLADLDRRDYLGKQIIGLLSEIENYQGCLYLEQKMYSDAMRRFLYAWEKTEKPRYLKNYGEALSLLEQVKQENYSHARWSANNRLDINPHSAQGYFLRAFANKGLGHLEESEQDYQKGVELSQQDNTIDKELLDLLLVPVQAMG